MIPTWPETDPFDLHISFWCRPQAEIIPISPPALVIIVNFPLLFSGLDLLESSDDCKFDFIYIPRDYFY